MRRHFTPGWLLYSAVGFIVLIGWAIYKASTVKEDRWMFAIAPIYALLSWSFFQAYKAIKRGKQNSN